jgi:DNA-binding transcriptional MerR regulator
MQGSEFCLKALCEAAHVTERTVRYYIAEGLLPPPQGARAQSRYTASHLERLQLIQRLKEQDFSLRQIKALLDEKARPELKPLLNPVYFAGENEEFTGLSAPRQPAPEAPFKSNTPSQTPIPPLVLFQSLNRTGQSSTRPAEAKPVQPLKMGFARSWTPDPPEIGPDPTPGSVEAQELSQVWEKLTIAPGIELLLEKTIADRNRPHLANLADQIKRKLGQ